MKHLRKIFLFLGLMHNLFSNANELTNSLQKLTDQLTKLGSVLNVPTKQGQLIQKKTFSYTTVDELAQQLKKELNIPDLNIISGSGFTFLSTVLFQGNRYRKRAAGGEPPIHHYWNQVDNPKVDKDDLKDLAETLGSLYKIHLMPKNLEDLYDIMYQIMHELQKNEQLQENIASIKIKTNLDELYKDNSLEQIKKTLQNMFFNQLVYFPIVVIYPAKGKKNVEYVLQKFCQLFGSMQGLDLTPRFNTKVTSLIYYAQGDADYKLPGYKEYFEDDFVHYKSDAFNKAGVMAPDGTYHLRIPKDCPKP